MLHENNNFAFHQMLQNNLVHHHSSVYLIIIIGKLLPPVSYLISRVYKVSPVSFNVKYIKTVLYIQSDIRILE